MATGVIAPDGGTGIWGLVCNHCKTPWVIADDQGRQAESMAEADVMANAAGWIVGSKDGQNYCSISCAGAKGQVVTVRPTEKLRDAIAEKGIDDVVAHLYRLLCSG